MSRALALASNRGLNTDAWPTSASIAVPPWAGLGTVATGWPPVVPPSPDALGVWISTPAISSTASTASAMTSAFWSLAMDIEPGDFTYRSSGPDGSKASVDRVPVQGVEPSRHVVRAPVLVLEVVGVLPHVDSQERRQLLHVRAVLVRETPHRELALPVGD